MPIDVCSSQLCQGLVRFIIQKDQKDDALATQATSSQNNEQPAIEIIISNAPPTAAQIEFQLNQLDIKCVSPEEITAIANADGSDTFNQNELLVLDNLLEERLYSDKNFVLAELAKKNNEFNIFTLTHSAPALCDDREVMLAAVKLAGWHFVMASDRLQQDRELALEAIKHDFPFSLIPSFLQHDKEIIAAAFNNFENNFHVIEQLKKAGIPIPPETESRYEQIINDLQRLGLSPARFHDLKIAAEIISNRDHLNIRDGRPVAVLIYMPASDSDSFVGTRFQELIEHGHQVIYFESHNEQEFYSAIESAGKGKRISVLEISGHGRYDWINFGASFPTTPETRDDLFIDFSDEKEMKKRHLARHLNKDAIILLLSCETCEGGPAADNMAGMMKRAFPQAQIFAPTEVASDLEFTYIFGLDNKIIGVSFRRNKDVTCIIK